MANPAVGRQAGRKEVYAQIHDGNAFAKEEGILLRELNSGEDPILEMFLAAAHALLAPTVAVGKFFDYDGADLDDSIPPPLSYKKRPLQYRLPVSRKRGRAASVSDEILEPDTKRHSSSTGGGYSSGARCSSGTVECGMDTTEYELYYTARGVQRCMSQGWLTTSTSPPTNLAPFGGFVDNSGRSEKRLQAAMMPNIEVVVRAVSVASGLELYTVDTHEMPIKDLKNKKPDVTIATQNFISSEPATQFVAKIVSFIEFKSGSGDFTAADVGQCVSYGDNLLHQVPHRNVVFVGLANEKTWCLVRVPRRDDARPTVVPEVSPRMSYNSEVGPRLWPFQALLCASFTELGFAFPVVPEGWIVGKSLGVGATSSVYELTGPDNAKYAMKLVSADVVEHEVAMTKLAHSRCPTGVCEVVDVPGMPAGVIVLWPVVTLLPDKPVTREHLLQLARILDDIATPRPGEVNGLPIVHRDVRRENVGLELTGGMRLLDFAFSVFALESKPRRGVLSFESDAILDAVIDGRTDVVTTPRDDHESFAKVGLVLGRPHTAILRGARRDEFGAPLKLDSEIAFKVRPVWYYPQWLTVKAILDGSATLCRDEVIDAIIAARATLHAVVGDGPALAGPADQ